jgi:aspartyl-tRNA(Asn)/glutamyl-tRNA(Gln) amidotransferase subunit C
MEIVSIKKIAELARITLTDEEADKFGMQVSEVIEYNAQKLSEVANLTKEKEIRQTSKLLGRSDEAAPSLRQDEALANVSKSENGFVVVQKVLD